MYASRFVCREKYTLISQISSILKPIFPDHTLTMFLRVEKQNILKRLMWTLNVESYKLLQKN